MLLLILVFILAAILFGLGFAVEILFWIALAVFLIWLIGILVGALSGGGRRWYRW